MALEKDSPRRERKKHAGHGAKEQGGKGGVVIAGVIVALAAAGYHFRGPVSSVVLPKVLSRTSNWKTPGGEFAVLGWANWLEKAGSSEDAARCCYPVDFKDLHASWCGGELDMLTDGIRLLSACSSTLRGRHEAEIRSFRSDHYEGTVRQSSRGNGEVFLVSQLKRRKLSKSEPAGSPTPAPACKLMEFCAQDKNKADRSCREMRRQLGDCFWN
ncbi:unnamed protein product [Amoebophrya sp. A25]|nr:unnamed protein product [Amoebophrya sp. A25]|eukprot:GSA25T00019104001.1